MRPRILSRLLLLLAALLGSTLSGLSGAHAQAPSPDAPEALHALLRGAGCTPVDLVAHGAQWVVACGAPGVSSVLVAAPRDGQLALIAQHGVQGTAHAVFLRAGEPWVEMRTAVALPLSSLPPLARGALPVAPTLAPQPAGAVVEVESAVAPRRLGALLVVEGSLRPFLPIGALAGAALAELSASYYAERAFYARVRAFPLGGRVGRGRDVGVLGAIAEAGYDHALFSVGLGAGAVRRGDGYASFSRDGIERWERDESVALAVVQAARLGALDGLSLRVTNAFLLDDARWRFGFLDASMQVPAGRRTWVGVAGGGGAQSGFFYAELSLRRLVRGDRGRGSLFVRPSVGLSGIDTRDSAGWSPGPMVGMHLEWRP